ncbi:MAG: tail fiber domain-containing protein, partial [Muribaculum sp.]|nr:tail fiber domain-containing protein [Muribaculum sp.]
MKKLILIAAFAACSFGMNAQLTVQKSGNVKIGQAFPYQPVVGSQQKELAATPTLDIDSVASMVILRNSSMYGRGAYITFGDLRKVGIGEAAASGDSDILDLFGEKGIVYSAGNNTVFSYLKPTALSAAFTFNCNVKANSFLTSSDARMKKDINGLVGISSMLADIEPVSYRLTDAAPAEKASAANEGAGEMKPMPPSDRVQYGFVAQEVREIFPELVVEDADGYLSIDYLGFIPILVDAYKNLEAKVKEQDETIALLTNNNARKSPAAGIDGILADGKATLFQNKPNPFRESTSIECIVPQGSTEAFVCVYDLQGSQVKRLDIAERGNCSVSVDGSTLKPGMYIYSLIID